jgi:glucose-6-phosphate 1-epimerase
MYRNRRSIESDLISPQPIFGPPPKEADESLKYHAKLSQHGFARNHNWVSPYPPLLRPSLGLNPLQTLDHIVMDRDSGVSVRFGLNPNPEIAAIFPHPFHLTYVVTLTKHELSTDIHVVNPDPKKSITGAVAAAAEAVTSALPTSITGTEQKTPQSVDDAATHELKFQALFHTYLRVDDASKVKIKGLKSELTYLDKVGGPWTERKWEGGDLVIDKQVDR